MARLHAYAPSSSKQGFYLRGRSPTQYVTFQMSRGAQALVRWLGFSEGERIPDDLLWRLYDSGLVWTKRNTRFDGRAEFFDYLGDDDRFVDLSGEQLSLLRQFIEEYEGPDADRVRRLRPLVSHVQLRASEARVQQFSAANRLSSLANQYFNHETVPSVVRRVLEGYGVRETDIELLAEYPAAVVDLVSEFSSTVFELTDVVVGTEQRMIEYHFEDSEMWVDEAMVWSTIRVVDRRADTERDVDFSIYTTSETDHELAVSDVRTAIDIRFGKISRCAVTVNGRTEVGLKIPTRPHDVFQRYAFDCTSRLFDPLSTYVYRGPGVEFVR